MWTLPSSVRLTSSRASTETILSFFSCLTASSPVRPLLDRHRLRCKGRVVLQTSAVSLPQSGTTRHYSWGSSATGGPTSRLGTKRSRSNNRSPRVPRSRPTSGRSKPLSDRDFRYQQADVAHRCIALRKFSSKLAHGRRSPRHSLASPVRSPSLGGFRSGANIFRTRRTVGDDRPRLVDGDCTASPRLVGPPCLPLSPDESRMGTSSVKARAPARVVNRFGSPSVPGSRPRRSVATRRGGGEDAGGVGLDE